MRAGARVTITGATGFVGGALLRRLAAGGLAADRLRALVRDPARGAAAGLPESGLVVGDLADDEALGRAVRGADVVFHVAGAVKATSPRTFFAANEDGTRRLVAAMLREAPRARLVHVSSLAAAGPSLDGATSVLPPGRCSPRSCYGESKRRGELALEAVGGALPWIVVRPPVVYGAGDAATRSLFRQALAPLVPVPFRPRPLSLIQVEDLVDALLRAADAAAEHRHVPVEGPDRTDTDALPRAMAAACGRRARLLRVPLAAAWPAACVMDVMAAARGRPALFGRDKLRDLRAPGWVADPAPARELFGFEPRVSSAEGIAAAARGFGLAPT